MSDRQENATTLSPKRPLGSYERVLDHGAKEADALLASLSVAQLRAGLEKGRKELALVDALDAIDQESMHDDIGHPGRHPSRSYETWVQNDSEQRRRMLHVAIRDVQDELIRRGETF